MSSTEEPSGVDTAALVAEIEADVRRRQDAGEYPAALLAQLHEEFRVRPDDDPPEVLAVVDFWRPLHSNHALGPAIVFTKRVVRRLIAWYVQPVAVDQTRFNTAMVRELRGIERRLARVETPETRGLGVPPIDAGADARVTGLGEGRTTAALRALRDAPSGRVLVAGSPAVAAAITRQRPVATATARVIPDLEHTAGDSLAAVALLGLLPRFSAAELLRIGTLATSALQDGGLLIADAPDPGYPATPSNPADLDVDMVRHVGRETAQLIWEAAGLTDVTIAPIGGGSGSGEIGPWYQIRGVAAN
ncbi:MAG: hypothetical protein ACR2GX_03840 [Candidatus Dormibacteria bacterium]